MIIGYARVSTEDQTNDTQIEQLKNLGCEKIFSENASGKDAERTELKSAMSYCREGDTLVVMKVDRLARNTVDALKIADKLKFKGVGLKCLDLGDTDINSDVGRVIYTVISAFAEMERKRILQRCNEGRARAKKEGKHLGRHRDTELHARIAELFNGDMSKAGIARELKVSRTTVVNSLKDQ
ncbi:recombinase family protein [Endozoicomonas acroporae]|uniref:recombinase family protein n=1 Tax=Endozoicomonas acroporae TaxID=1701104 RepID=UPI003D7AA042